MNEVQIVISIIRYSDAAGRAAGFGLGYGSYSTMKAWLVKLGLDVVGVVYRVRDDDERYEPQQRGRWAWEGAGSGCSLDEDQGETHYGTRQEAVWALLTQREQDQIAENG